MITFTLSLSPLNGISYCPDNTELREDNGT